MKQTIGLFGAVLAMGLGFAEMEPATPESQGEALGGYVGEHEIAASGGVDTAGTLRIQAYLTGDTGHFDFAIDQKGKLTCEFWAMNGCKLESK